ncbi:hypothetical protein [Desulfonatronospira sp.]|uniref:hypothetical protein n=1 Tax=Desulfonatronospira sp. TaxID=1962951 RepID=UPI0025C58173|nr:hypothetical protein [Desulfonatronospira sp.]
MNAPEKYYCPFCSTGIPEFYVVCPGCSRFMVDRLLLRSLPAIDRPRKNKAGPSGKEAEGDGNEPGGMD